MEEEMREAGRVKVGREIGEEKDRQKDRWLSRD